ncbi:MAG: sigma-70 family RNA polymerase sigma factor [Nanoarchaeota archaeon]
MVALREKSSLEIYLGEIRSEEYAPLSKKEEVDLFKDYENGDKEIAREKIINSNLRLVVNIASGYNFGFLPLEDLIGGGNLGLFRAIEKFDYTRGYKFSTYARSWIKKHILKAIGESRLLGLPNYASFYLSNILKEKSKIELRGETGDNEKIAENLNIRPSLVKRLLKHPKLVYLEDSLNEEYYMKNEENTEEIVDSFLLKGYVSELLLSLGDYRDRKIIELIYNLGEEEEIIDLSGEDGEEEIIEKKREKNLAEVGRELNLTRERIRQIKNRALGKLRKRAEGLRDYLN